MAPVILITLLSLLLLPFYILRRSRRSPKAPTHHKPAPPEAAGGWPIIGHLRLLSGPELPHVALGSMAEEYGPVFTIRLGHQLTLVVSSHEMVRDCYTTSDLAFSNRPSNTAVELMCYNYAMFGFSPYGSYWRDMRKITTLELLSHHRLSTLRHLREAELRAAIRDLHELCVKNERPLVEMKRWFGDLTMNVIVRIILGVRLKETEVGSAEAERWRKAVRDFFELMGVFTLSDVAPWLRWLDLDGYQRAMEKTAREMDGILQEWLVKHKRKRSSGAAAEGGGGAEQDFMDVMVSILEGATAREVAKVYDADIINKSTCLVRF